MVIQPGDCLLYSGTDLLSRLIRIKTWSDVSHVEVVVNQNVAMTSRERGVDLYGIRLKNLRYILRPIPEDQPLDFGAAMRWFKTVRGQAYDVIGLFRFFTWGTQSTDKQFCSEVVTRWYRAAGFQPFAQNYDADLVSPGMYLSSPHFRRVEGFKHGQRETAGFRTRRAIR